MPIHIIGVIAPLLAVILVNLAGTDPSIFMLAWLSLTLVLMLVLWLVGAMIRIWQATEP